MLLSLQTINKESIHTNPKNVPTTINVRPNTTSVALGADMNF